MSRLLFIKTGYVIPGIPAELGDFEHWTAAAAGLPLERCHVVPVIDGERLPVARDYSGVVISGSAAMVTSREPWSEYTADWLRETVESGVPMLGICYGHQLLAQALGGASTITRAGVKWVPRGSTRRPLRSRMNSLLPCRHDFRRR